MAQFNIRIAKNRLSELVQRATLGEEIIIARYNKPVAKLTTLQPITCKFKRRLGSAKGLFKIAKDFNKPFIE